MESMNRGDMVLAAMQYYATEAVPGGASNPLVLGFFQKAGHPEIKNDDTPWCAAFLDSIARQVGAPSTSSLLALDWLKIGHPIESPAFGDVVCFDWTKIGESGGHVGLVVALFPTLIYVLGGNESNRVQISAYNPRAVAGFRRILAE